MAMRSVSQSLNLLTTAIGSLIVIPMIYIVNSDPSKILCNVSTVFLLFVINIITYCWLDNEWLPVNLDDGHLTWYFLLLAALMVLTHVSLFNGSY